MTRKALNAFDPNKLGVGEHRIFEVRNPKTGFGEHHYFYCDHDGELFTVVCKNMNDAIRLRNEWKKKKQTAKGGEVYQAVIAKIKSYLAEIESDERLEYPTANIVTNAPLALIQCALENQRIAVKRVLRIIEGDMQ